MPKQSRKAKKEARQRIELQFLKSKKALSPTTSQDEVAIQTAVEAETKMKWGKGTIHGDLQSLEDQGKVASTGSPTRWYLTSKEN